MENKIKHLELIQNVIARMAGNLFFLKGWTITLIAGLFALAAKDANQRYLIIAYFPVIIFWSLDAYFLSQERRYRALYDDVRKLDDSKIDFSMDTTAYASLSKNRWAGCLLSKTLLGFYVPLIVVMLLVAYFLK